MVGYSDGDKEIRTIESDTYAFALDLNTKSGDKKIITSIALDKVTREDG